MASCCRAGGERAKRVVAFSLALLVVSGASARASIDPATQLYVDTVAAMQNLPEPPYVTYRLVTETGTGLQVSLSVYDHEVWLSFAPGKNVAQWSVAHRAGDFRSLIIDADGRRYGTNRAFFDPTWDSAYHAMRTGMFFDAPTHSQPDQRAVPTPAPTFTPDPAFKTIAQAQVAVATLYTAQFRGVAKCPNGDAGRSLQFAARGDPMQYQLVGAVVDVPLHLFCVLMFTLPSLEGTPLTDVQFYGERDGYWLRTGGEFVRTTNKRISTDVGVGAPPLGPGVSDIPYNPNLPPSITTVVRSTLTLRYALTEMDFPQIVPDDFFIPPPGQ